MALKSKIMNYTVKAYKMVTKDRDLTLEDYEKVVANYVEARKEVIRLKSLGNYTNISINKNKGGV